MFNLVLERNRMNDPLNEPPAPSMEALVAGTFALMTSWANPNPVARVSVEKQRDLIARKIVSNLFFLQNHPDATDRLRCVLSFTHEKWMSIAACEYSGDGSYSLNSCIISSVKSDLIH